MTVLLTAVLLALAHASLVVAAALIARACIPRRLAAGRVSVGLVGMACLLSVTALAALPLPGVWPAIVGNAHETPLATAGSDAKPVDESAAMSSNASNEAEPSLAVSGWRLVAWLRSVGMGVEQVATAAERSPPIWLWLVLGTLVCGAGISLTRLLLAIGAVGRLRRASRPIAAESLGLMVDDVKRRCGCRRAIELREIANLGGAVTFGWLRPVIVLPSDWSAWSPEELEAALAHEIAHVHRADYVQRLMALVGAAIHFYHPLVRAAARRLALDQELAADTLARELVADERAYLHGLARLALRYHESPSDRSAWSSVSIVPRSSDFLARRLEMLRITNSSIGRRTARAITWGTSACLVATALTTALLRGRAAADEKPAGEKPVAETARLEKRDVSPQKIDAADSSTTDLFRHAAFDPSIMRVSKRGGFLIRVGEIARHPRFAKFIPLLNQQLSTGLSEYLKVPNVPVDVGAVEWMAGNLQVISRPPKTPEDQSKFMLGWQAVVIRMKQPANWQQLILETWPGSTLESDNGRAYVELPEIPAIGQGKPVLRFPDDTTIVAHFGYDVFHTNDTVREKFFDDTPADHVWDEAWRAVDGGLITLAFDNRTVGWQDFKEDQREEPKAAWLLADKIDVVALSADWNGTIDRATLRARGTCADPAAAKEAEQAALAVLPFFMEELGKELATAKENDPDRAYSQQWLEALRTVKVVRSSDEVDKPFLQFTADAFVPLPDLNTAVAEPKP